MPETLADELTDIPTARAWSSDLLAWRVALFRCMPLPGTFSLVWKVAQLPLYAQPANAPLRCIGYPVLDCTASDVLIGLGALLAPFVATRAGKFSSAFAPQR